MALALLPHLQPNTNTHINAGVKQIKSMRTHAMCSKRRGWAGLTHQSGDARCHLLDPCLRAGVLVPQVGKELAGIANDVGVREMVGVA